MTRMAKVTGRVGFALASFTLAFAALPATARAECPENRPTDASPPSGYVYAGTPKSFATPGGGGRVWWTETGIHAPALATTRTDGVPDSVATVGAVLDEAIAGYAKLGFRPALRDGDYTCGSNGGDDRVDVYLVSFKGADGQTVSERCKMVGTTQQCPGFILVERNFVSKGYSSQREGAETVVAHEYFHMVQNAYDQKMDRWWAEGTAQWSTKQLYPALLDLERNLPAFFSEVSRPIDTPPSGATAGFLYGAAIWPVFLAEQQGPDSIKLVMDAVAAGKGTVLPATEDVLVGKGTSLADVFGTFAVWNAATGKRAGLGGYKDAARYPMVKVEAFPEGAPAELSGITAGFAARYYTTNDVAERVLSLEADETRLGAFAAPIRGGQVDVAQAKPLPAKVSGEVMIVLAGRSSKKTDVPWKLVAALPATEPEPTPTPTASTDSGGGCSTGRTSSGSALGLMLVAGLFARRRARPRSTRASSSL